MRRSRTAKRLWLLVAAILAAGVGGCAGRSCIDPSGEHIFIPPPPNPPPSTVDPSNLRYFDEPLTQIPSDDAAVLLDPREESVAPVGSEAILIAGVAGSDGYLRTNRRLEWTIAPGSVGHFIAVAKNSISDWFFGDFNEPRIIHSTFAVGSTSRRNIRLNRGTCTTDDDKFVLRGQSWISITSPIEGTSHVSVTAPSVYGWDARTKTATIHWVDALIQYPPPAINPAGSRHAFTTTVTRQSNQSPCEGWLVRYEIAGGPPAGFAPSGSQTAEARTNSAGQATVEIFQTQPAHGQNVVRIEVVRPADTPGAGGKPLVVGRGSTTKTWSAADLSVNITGPAAAAVGSTAVYRVELTNPGDLTATNVEVSLDLPDGLTLVGSNPQGQAAGGKMRWQFAELGARRTQSIEASFRVERPGSAAVCCAATAAGGLKATDCATTTLGAAAPAPPTAGTTPAALMDVRIEPAQATAGVGEKFAFEVVLTNRGTTAASNIVITLQLDPGLKHAYAEASNTIRRKLQSLSAGETQRIGVETIVRQPGRLRNTVEITGPGLSPARAEGYVTVEGGAAAPSPPPGATPSTPLPPPATVPLSVRVTGPGKPVAVGQTAQFTVDAVNIGTAPLRNVVISIRWDPSLDPTMATAGWVVNRGALEWTIDELPAGEKAQRVAQCTCLTTAAKAAVRAAVRLPDGNRAEGEAYVEIVAADFSPGATAPKLPEASPADNLVFSVVPLSNPLRLGKQLSVAIRVLNRGKTTCNHIGVATDLPAGMTAIPLGTSGPSEVKIEGSTVQFAPTADLAPGQSLTYYVKMLARQPGTYRIAATLTAECLTSPMKQESDPVEVGN